MEQGLHLVQRDISKAYFNDKYNLNIPTPYTLEQAFALDNYLKNNLSDEWKEAYRINHAGYSRKTRLQNRISYMLSLGTCFFVTLTFTDSVLSSTSRDTRRRYVRRVLSSLSNVYVANIDFGEENGREHYHAVVCCDSLPDNFWTYGFYKADIIRVDDKSPVRLAKYITKLTNHAIKETCCGCKCIYSRSN